MDLQIAAVSFAQMFHAIFYRNVSGLLSTITHLWNVSYVLHQTHLLNHLHVQRKKKDDSYQEHMYFAALISSCSYRI